MSEEERQEIEAFAKKIFHTFFCDADEEFLISTFAPEIVWVGGGPGQRGEGAEEVAACFRAGKSGMMPCDMSGERYVTAPLADNLYLCEGDSWISPKRGTGMYFKIHQRASFIFRRTGEGLRIVHMHNSVGYSDIQEGQLFPVQAAGEAYENLKEVLDKKDRQIELMLSQMPGGMKICRPDEQFTTLWISDSLCKLLGYTGGEEYSLLTRDRSSDFIAAEDLEMVRREVIGKELGQVYHCEYRIHRKDGASIWVSDIGNRSIGEDGEEVIYSFLADISERKSREEEIGKVNAEVKRQANFLQQLYNTIPCGILQFTTDPSHLTVNVNRMVWEYYGYPSERSFMEEIRSPLQLVLPKEREALREKIDGLKQKGGMLTYTRHTKKKDGADRWISVVMERLVNADGQDVIQAIFTDITEIRKFQIAQEQERLIENQSLRAAICTVYPLIFNVNLTRDEYYCFIEEQARYLEHPSGGFCTLENRLLQNILPSYREEYEKKFSMDAIRSQFETGEKEIYLETRVMDLKEACHWISVQLIRVDNPVNDDVLAIKLIKVLDEQRAERAVQEALLRDALTAARAASNAKSDFLSRMSHDIRTPMNAVIGMSAIGRLKLDNRAAVLDCFDKIDSASRYLLSLINDILDMSKIESGKMGISKAPFDFTEMFREIISIVYPQTVDLKQKFEVRHREPIEQYYIGDVLRIKQVLMNLLSNALKFTPPGGGIFIETSEERRADGFAHVRFVVRDTGVGISDEFRERMFHAFEQESLDRARNNVGSGLGLAIVYNLVQMMNGVIGVESRKGEGTTFTIEIPLGLAQDDEAKEQMQKMRDIMKGARILVADEDETVCRQVSLVLEEIGAEVNWASSGAGAVECAARARESGESCGAALISWRMPDMAGEELTGRIRRIVGPGTAIIISAYDWSGIEAEAREAGADFFISKPLFASTIRRTFSGMSMGLCREMSIPANPAFDGQRILLVEDNELNREIAKTLLETYRLTVDTAVDGREAVERFSGAPAGYYKVILMDIRMPVMDGLEATRMIRGQEQAGGKEVPILAMTANAFAEDKEIALEAGMDGYLVKPLDMTAVLAELKRYIR